MNDDLKYTFDNINAWLNFAEAKNVGLLVLNFTSVIGIMQSRSIFTGSKTLEGILIIIFCASTCVCVFSLLPIAGKGYKFYKKMNESHFVKQIDTINSIYFGDVALLSVNQFIRLFEHKNNVTLSASEKDLASEISINAQICCQKLAYFRLAAGLSVTAFFLGAVIVAFSAFK